MFNHLVTSTKSIDGKKVGINYVLNSALANYGLTFSQKIEFPNGDKYFGVGSSLNLLFATDNNYAQFVYLIVSGYNQNTRIIPLVTHSNISVSVTSFKTLKLTNNGGAITANIYTISLRY